MRRARVLTALCWVVAAGFAVWAVVRAFGLADGYPAVPLLSFTPYVALAGVVATGVALLLHRRLPALVAALSSIVLIVLIAPRAFSDDPPDPLPTGPSVKVMSSNLLVGSADVAELGDLVRDGDVDILTIAELTPESEAELRRSEVGRQLPYRVVDPQRDASGTGLFSRYPVERLPAPGDNGFDLPTIIARAAIPGGPAEIYSIHPPPPTTGANVATIERYFEAIPTTTGSGDPRLLIGDFNSTLDSEALRDLLDRGYTDAADAAGEGLSWTWPQRLYPPPVTIDHVIVDERVEVLDVETAGLPGSDHRTVLAELRLPASG